MNSLTEIIHKNEVGGGHCVPGGSRAVVESLLTLP